MNNSTPLHHIVFVTDKYGKRNKTGDIEKLLYDSRKDVYFITYKDGKTYPCRSCDIQIIKNCLKDKQSSTVFDYLLQMAQFSDIKNDEGQNLLEKTFEKSRFVNEYSVLARYLNPKKGKEEKSKIKSLIFPFGCNNSQFKAVSTALNNQISIIQGPPGTGKTQTILNIIANLLMHDKTVLIVSNNNDATRNVYEKLASDKYGLGFICAFQGKKENIENFLQNQKQFYPSYLKDWMNQLPVFQALLDEDIKHLGKYFEANERISEIHAELSALETESKYFDNSAHDIYSSTKLLKKSSDVLMSLLQDIQFKYAEKEKLGFFTNLKLKFSYGLGERKTFKSNPEKVIETLKAAYYSLKKKELETELQEKKAVVTGFNPSEVYEKCLTALRFNIAKKYSNNNARVQFKDSKEIYFDPVSFTNEYPVILSTTFSSRATIGQGTDFLFDYVIMDEASQVDIVTGALALSCAKNAVIVGDKMQLPNVIEENKKKVVQELFEQTKLPEGYNYLNSFLASLEQVLPDTPQTLLREHYRCHPKIINFCNQQFYGGKLLIMTEDKGEKDVLKAIRTVPGNFCKEHYNQRQIDIIKDEILPEYTENEIENLGIIAPYNNQTKAIQSQIPGIDAATVHKYQGREKDNIIISTVDNEITSFADDSNMLNVAISRAKKKLAVVLSGNKQPENSNLMALLKYIQYNNFSVENSKINSIFDFFYTKDTEAKFAYLKSANKISKYDSENAMNVLLTKITNEPKYSKFSFVFEMPLKDVVNKKFIGKLPQELASFANRSWAHVDFTVFNRVTKRDFIWYRS
ncbi:AAA domain-containing protein [Treponema sp.]|uniref:AAA domain-containing protein n=1 Tax=Treponema sp. TaxID=166 RepID=UPI003F0336B2